MNSLLQDTRFAIRMLAKNPGFATITLITLVLGIGANTAIFSVINAVVLRPLPFEKPEQLVIVRETEQADDSGAGLASYPNFEDWRSQSHVFEDMAAFHASSFTLTGGDQPERITGAAVSASFFPLLRVKPTMGRTFQPGDDLSGAENVAIVSHSFWQRHFADATRLAGSALTLDGRSYAVVGVLPAGFSFPVRVSEAEVWTSMALDADTFPRGAHSLQVVARLKPGVSVTRAQAEMDTIARQLEQQYPDTNTGRGIHLISLHERVVGDIRPALAVLLGAVGLVLLIACANVGNLLLARSARRTRELAIRVALGAGRARLISQLLTESVLIGLVGGVLGLLLAVWGTQVLLTTLPADLPRLHTVDFDGRVLTFTLVISLLAGVLFGLAPALAASRVDLHESLKEGGRTPIPRRGRRLRSVLAVSEIALSFVLLIGAGLLLRSFQRLTDVDPGFGPDNVLTFRMSVPLAQYSDPHGRADLYRQVLDRMEALPGVQSVGAAAALPLEHARIELTFEVVGRPQPAPGQDPRARYNSVSAHYFRTLGIPLRKGRLFTDQDGRDSPGVTIINEAMARRFWPTEDPIGQRLRPSATLSDDEPEHFEIVGIVGDVRDRALGTPAMPCMYFPYQQQTWPFVTFALKTSVDPLTLAGAVVSEVAEVTRTEAAYGFKTMEQQLADSIDQPRFLVLLLGIFASVAVILAAAGIYGVLSCSVAQRTHEIGVRMALGAQQGRVMRLVLKQGCTLATVGLAIGLVASFAGSRVLSRLLYGVGTTDPVTFVGVSLLLGAVALLACYIPAHRATKVDPMVALRCE
jgi:putative ABC transport system permease protein